jgi:hypothetical protein
MILLLTFSLRPAQGLDIFKWPLYSTRLPCTVQDYTQCITPRRTIKGNPITGLNRPLGLQEVEAPRISRKSTNEGGKVVSPTHRPPLPAQEICLVLISVRGSVDSRAIVRPGRIMSIENPNVRVRNQTRNFPSCSSVHQQKTVLQ